MMLSLKDIVLPQDSLVTVLLSDVLVLHIILCRFICVIATYSVSWLFHSAICYVSGSVIVF